MPSDCEVANQQTEQHIDSQRRELNISVRKSSNCK